MKKFLLFLAVCCTLAATAQTDIFDPVTLRNRINAEIITNGNQQITGAQLNKILNGVLNVMPTFSNGLTQSGSFPYTTKQGGNLNAHTTLNGVSTFDYTFSNIRNFSITGSTIALNLPTNATGDMYYRNSGGTLSRLAIGTTGQVLTVSSGLPAWITPAGGGGGSGITQLNGDIAAIQSFATGTAGTDFGISTASGVHTFDLPTASATNRGALSSADWSTFNGKQDALTLTTTGTSGAATLVGATLNIPNYAGGGTPTWQQTLTSGSTLTTANTVTQGANRLTFTGSGTSNSLANFNVDGSGSNGLAMAITTAGRGLLITGSAAGHNPLTVDAQGSGFGTEISSINGPSLYLHRGPASTNTVVTTLQLSRFSTGTAAAGIGQSIDFYNQNDAGSGALSNQIISKLTSAASASRTSQMDIVGFNAGTQNTLVSFLGSGQMMLPIYTGATFDATATKALGVDATGKVVTFTPATGSGTVTDVSVVSANGFAGTVATSTTTPAITLSTTITGLLKGNGTAISAATPGTDYLVTEVDGSVSNELQTIANTSNATSHTVTLSNSGGSVQFIEGANISLTTGGTGSAGTVTIAATGVVTSETDPLALKIASNLSDLNNVATARGNLGGTTVGQSFFTATNPSAITFPKVSATNVVSFESAATHLASVGAQPQLNGTGFVKVTGTTVSYDNSTYVSGAAGSNTQIQFNNSGAFAGDADLTFNPTGNILGVGGSIQNASGSLSTPSYSFTSATSTGMYYTSGNGGSIRLTLGGVQMGNFNFAPVSSTGGQGNLFLGYHAGELNYTVGTGLVGLNNTAVGDESFITNDAGQQNSAFGSRSLHQNTSGDQNTALGQGAMYENTTGVQGTGVGFHALLNNIGGWNTAVGAQAMEAAVGSTAIENVAVGNLSQGLISSGQKNVSVGRYSLYSNTSGSRNTAVGTVALIDQTSGDDNTAVGANAGYTATPANHLTTGAQNTFIGSGTGFASTTQRSKSIAIGYNSLVNANNVMNIGGTGADAVNVGIGITAATARLNLPAGTTAAGSAPLKFTSGTAMTTAEDGAMEYHGSHLYFTVGSTRFQLDQQGGTGANALGTYIVQTATNAPANAQVLASLSTGIVKVTTTTGVLSTAVAGDFPTLNQSTTGSAATVSGTNVITNANLRQSAAKSVIGNSTNTTANVADISASSADQVLVNNAGNTAIGWGTVATGGITNNAVTIAKMQQINTASFLGRTTASTGNVEVLTATQATALLNVATTALKGLVPAPVTATGLFLKDDLTWAAATVSQPNTQVVFGTGTGVSSDADMTFNTTSNSLTLAAGGYIGTSFEINSLTGTMATPSVGHGIYYFKTDKLPYAMNSDGTEMALYNTGLTNPMTTLGDIIYGGASGVSTRLAGNTTTTKKFLTSTGAAGAATAPGWNTLVAGDIPDLAASYIKNQTTAQTSASLNIDGTAVIGNLVDLSALGPKLAITKLESALASGTKAALYNYSTSASPAGGAMVAMMNYQQVTGGGAVSGPFTGGQNNILRLEDVDYTYTTSALWAASLSQVTVNNTSTADRLANLRVYTEIFNNSTVTDFRAVYIEQPTFSGGTNVISTYYPIYQEGAGYNFFQGEILSGTVSDAGSYSLQVYGNLFNNTYYDQLEITAPSTPASGRGRWYVNSTDSKAHFMTDGGVDYDLTASGGSSTTTVTYVTSAPYTVLSTDDNIVTTGGGTITMPTASSYTGKKITITNKTNSAATISPAYTIEGAGTGTALPRASTYAFVSDGSVWRMQPVNGSDEYVTAGTGDVTMISSYGISSTTGLTTATFNSMLGSNGISVVNDFANSKIDFTLVTQMSLTKDASGIKLVGDAATPGNSKYWGTDASGVKGFYALPAGGSAAVSTLTDVTLTSLATNDFLKYNGTVWINRTPTNVRADLSITNVENTALSTWAGTSNIVTLGTVTTGTWNGSLIAGQYGGTGVNNSGKTITLGGNLTTSGAFATTLTATAATNVTLPTTGTLATVSGAETFTNKRISKRLNSAAASATPTPSADNDDIFQLTAQNATAAFAAPTGTPTDGQMIQVVIKDNGTAQSITWNAIYRSGTDVTLPTTTTLGKILRCLFQYNSGASKWDIIAKADGY